MTKISATKRKVDDIVIMIINIVLVIAMVVCGLLAIKEGLAWFKDQAGILSVLVPLGLLAVVAVLWGFVPGKKKKPAMEAVTSKKKKVSEDESEDLADVEAKIRAKKREYVDVMKRAEALEEEINALLSLKEQEEAKEKEEWDYYHKSHS